MGFRLNNCVDTGGIPLYLIKEFLKEIDIPVMVETGTASGASITEASKYFKQCHTIEINETRPIRNVELKNVIWHTGNSIDILPKVVDSLIEYKEENKIENHHYCLFWLDSHFDGDKPNDSKYKDCYLLEELEIISKYSQDSLIFIDDARLFLGQPPYPNEATQWPMIQDIFGTLKSRFPYHYYTITDDYIISIPDRLKWILDREWMANYHIRYPNEADKLKMQVKDVYSSFIKYINC